MTPRSGTIRGLDEPPIIIGHSFGGLITMLLLDRGLGDSAVCISPAQPGHVSHRGDLP